MKYRIVIEVVPRDGNTADDIRQFITDVLADRAKEFNISYAELITARKFTAKQ